MQSGSKVLSSYRGSGVGRGEYSQKASYVSGILVLSLSGPPVLNMISGPPAALSLLPRSSDVK